MGGGRGESPVEGVQKGGIEGPEGELVDDVREIERWKGRPWCQHRSSSHWAVSGG